MINPVPQVQQNVRVPAQVSALPAHPVQAQLVLYSHLRLVQASAHQVPVQNNVLPVLVQAQAL